jgi:uncharacterized integral membrane protein
MITTNLLEYFKDLRENYDNFKNIEGFVVDPFWGDTDYIPESFKQDGKIVNPCFKYNSNEVNQLDQECVKRILSESTSSQQTAALKKVFNIDIPATTTPVTTEMKQPVTPTVATKQPVTTLTPATTTPTTTPATTTPTTTPATTTPVATSTSPTTSPNLKEIDDLCSGNILDFKCNKNLKILIWCLIIVCVLLVISFIIYIMYNSKQKENTTPVKELYTTSSPTTDVSFSPPPPKMKYQNNTNQREGFLKRMLGGKNRRKH